MYGLIDHSATARPKVTAAFKKLRKNFGFVARQNFACCGSCAWAEIDTPKNANKPIVFYHQQGNTRFKNTGSVNLIFGRIVEDAQDSDIVLIGKLIVEALTNEGLAVNWDGTADNTIEIVGENDNG